MLPRNAGGAGWHMKLSGALGPPLTCSYAPVRTLSGAACCRLRFPERYCVKGEHCMAPEDARLKDVQAWLSKAALDLHWSTDRQLDRLADTAEHFHERIDGELGGFLIHHVGHTRARDHQNLGGLGLL
jgi:hypothetical protein